MEATSSEDGEIAQRKNEEDYEICAKASADPVISNELQPVPKLLVPNTHILRSFGATQEFS